MNPRPVLALLAVAVMLALALGGVVLHETAARSPSASAPAATPPTGAQATVIHAPATVSPPPSGSHRIPGESAISPSTAAHTETTTYTWTFTESGLPSGTSWYLWWYFDSTTCSGTYTNETSTTTTISVTEAADDASSACIGGTSATHISDYSFSPVSETDVAAGTYSITFTFDPFVASWGGNSTGSSDVVDASVTAGDLLLVAVTAFTATASTTDGAAVSDSQGNAYTLVNYQYEPTFGVVEVLEYAFVSTTGTDSVTASISGYTQYVVWVTEWAGLYGVSIVGGTNGTSTSVSATFTASSAVFFAIGYGRVTGSQTSTFPVTGPTTNYQTDIVGDYDYGVSTPAATYSASTADNTYYAAIWVNMSATPGPVTVKGILIGEEYLDISWTNPNGATGDVVKEAPYSSGSCGTYSTLYSGSAITSYNVTGLSPKTEYCLSVTPTNSAGDGTATIEDETTIGASAIITPSKDPTDAGASVTFSSAVTGATPYTYSWTVDGTVESTSSSLTYTFADSGSYAVNLTVTDADGSTATTTNTETVNAALAATASANLTTADVGYSVAFTGSATGGTSPYTYSWTLSGTQISTAASFDYAFTSAGTKTVDLTVTDNAGFTDTTSVTVTVNADPSVTATSSSNPSDVNYAVTFTATETGGTGSISYAWYVGGTQEGTGTTLSYTFAATGDYTVEVEVEDADKQTSTYTITQTVNALPTASVTLSPNPTDVGVQSVFTATVSGGVSPYTYTWTVAGAAVCSNSATCDYTPTSSGTYTVEISVKDGDGNTATQTADLTVNGDVSASVSSSQNPTDVGNTVTYTASASGGVTPYTYAWTEGSTSVCSTSSTCSLDMSSAGSITITVKVTDAVGNTYSVSLTETVNADPSVTISSSQNPTDVGETPTFSAAVTGGTSPYTYAWTVNGATQSSTSSSMSYEFTATGSYYVNVTAKDANGNTAVYSFTETVNADPSATVSPSVNPTDAGVAVTFTATETGGTGTISYAWTVNSVAQSSTSSTLSWTPTASGSYTVEVTVTDSVSKTASASVTETVNADPSVTISAQYNPVDKGVTDVFTPTVTAGTGPYTYSWTVAGTVEGTGSTLSYAFGATGSYSVALTVTDSLGQTASASLTVTVNTDPAATASGPSAWDEGVSASWTATVNYGVSPYTYTWSVNGASVGTSSSLTYTFTSTGSFTLNLTVTDTDGVKAYWQETVTVNAQPSVTVSASASAADVGSSVTFTPTITAGTGPYTYAWYANGGEVGTASTLTWSVADTGNNEVYVTITDAAGAKATSADVIVTGNAAPSLAASPAHGTIDTGYSDGITATVTGGTAPYTYSWSIVSGTGGTLSGSGSTVDFSATSAGTFKVNVTVTDTDGNSATASVTITVVASPSVTETVSPTSVSVGVNATYTATVTGGVSPYTYAWARNGTAIGTSNPLHYEFTAAGVYYVNVTVTDADGQTASASLKVTVTNAPSATITESATATDVGLSVSFGSSVTGGTSPYTYAWYVAGAKEGTASTLDFLFSSVGTFEVQLTVTDSDSLTGSAFVNITVHEGLGGKLSAAYTLIDVGISDTFRATALNGTGPYTYAWSDAAGALAGTSANESYSFSSTGTYTISVNITDAVGEVVTVKVSVTVVAAPTAGITAEYSPVDAGVNDSFTPTVTAGVGPYTYSWLVSGHTYTSKDLALTFAVGTYTIQLTVTDSFGLQSSVSLSLTVVGDPVVTPTLVNPPVVVSLPAEYHATATGGYGTYSFLWSFPADQQVTGAFANYTWESSGTVAYQLTFRDQGGFSETLDLTGYAHLFVEASANQTKGFSPLEVGFSESVLGGSGYVYNWTFGDGQTSDLALVTVTFAAGNYTVELVVTSANGAKGFSNITISASAGAPPTIVVTGVPTDTVPGTVITANAEKSTAPSPITSYVWTWVGKVYTGSVVNLFVNATGTFALTLVVTDSRGATANETLTVTVTPAGDDTSIVISLTKSTSGSTLDFALQVKAPDGVSAVDVFFDSQLLPVTEVNSSATEANYTFSIDESSYTVSGSYTLTVYAWDNQGNSNSLTEQVTINPPPGVNWLGVFIADLGGTTNFLALIGVLAGVIGTIAAVYGLRSAKDTTIIDVDGTEIKGRKGKPAQIIAPPPQRQPRRRL